MARLLQLLLLHSLLVYHIHAFPVRSKPILTASDAPTAFDAACVANPVVLQPLAEGDEWQCYYYGNDGAWNGGRKGFLPTGASGLATSKDGWQWRKVPGVERGGAVLGPSDTGWDGVHTGVGDVVRVGEELHMYYFGGDDEESSMGPTKVVGLRMRIGRAKSGDHGRTWHKDPDYVLDYDPSEGLFASWPRVVTLDAGPWTMFYHAFDGKKFRVYAAESDDEGDSWRRTGLVLEGSDSEDAFDFGGIGTRSVVPWRNGLLMIYEGVDKSLKHRLGAAYCEDGGKWIKLNGAKPILEPGKEPLGEWTQQVIGTPCAVSMPDGSLRVYHCGKDGPDGQMAIGVVVSETGGIEPDCWRALETVVEAP